MSIIAREIDLNGSQKIAGMLEIANDLAVIEIQTPGEHLVNMNEIDQLRHWIEGEDLAKLGKGQQEVILLFPAKEGEWCDNPEVV